MRVKSIVTTAPTDYDYPRITLGSVPLGVMDARGREWRVVVLDAAEADYQVGRYGSGLHAAHSLEHWTHE